MGGLTNYDSSLACFNDNGAGGGIANNGIKDGDEASVTPRRRQRVAVAKGDDVVCTFTNTRQRGSIELKKTWVGHGGPDDAVHRHQGRRHPGRHPADRRRRRRAASTGANAVDTGTFFVSETAATPTSAPALSCFNDNGAGAGGVANDGIQNGTERASARTNNSVAVAHGRRRGLHLHQHPQPGRIELRKASWAPRARRRCTSGPGPAAPRSTPS